MKLTKICVLIRALVMCCTMFTACGSSDLDTGVFKVEASSDWNIQKRKVDGSEQDNQVYVIKDGEDANSYASLLIIYYKDASTYASAKSFYNDAQDLAPLQIGDRTWEGYKYTSSGYPGTCLTSKDGNGLWVCLFVLENGDNKITIEDEDVKTILSSLKIK